MQEDFSAFQRQCKDKVEGFLVGVTWHFNSPANPHAGGLWESAVKSIKRLLLVHLSNTNLSYEEFNTVLVQVEGCHSKWTLVHLEFNERQPKINK